MVCLTELQQKFGSEITESHFRDNRRLDVPAAAVLPLLTSLKSDYGFNMLVDLTAVDWLEYDGATDRFSVIYLLLNVDSGERLAIRVPVNLPDAVLPSVYSL
ncbi:MAG: NADH-quinone oxidoreductase subunit C, partial [Planctomycetaceae bacterium]